MMSFARPQTTAPDVERRELEWWEKFAEAEERFAWVQTSMLQRILRGRYVRDIVRAAGSQGTILELGCGVGWLSLILARAGAAKVVGVDFSSAQIDIANQRAAAAALSSRVQFRCLDGTVGDQTAERYDCVLVHGFLHHLNQTEIHRVLANAPLLLKPKGVLIVLEPVLSKDIGAHRTSKWEKRLHILGWLANAGRRYGVRHISASELHWRNLLSQRNWGLPPHGPSPKEMPFEPGELESYLTPGFEIERRQECMAISHLVVQEWLLRQISHPVTSRLLLPVIAWLAACWDRKMISSSDPPPGIWVFTMFICRPLKQC
jgi:2-polyprenyl-3-methyl-5-hydroxy-6-metoxy-1,4-benzoquinol methylase